MRRTTSLALVLALSAFGCNSPAPPKPVDVTLTAPPAGQGWQWEVPSFPVPSGTELQSCYFYAIPGTPGTDVWVNRITVAQNTGSHHMNIFRVKTITGLSGNPGDTVVNGQCFGPSSNWADWPLVINSQDDQQVDWTLPDTVGYKFQAGELVMLQTHYVNATTQQTPLSGHVLVNFWQPSAALPNEVGTLFATNQHIRICPGDMNKTFEAKCTFPSQGVNIIAANGHFHSRGTKFNISTIDATGALGATPFYTSNTWNDPPMERGLNVTVPQNGGIDWQCSFDYSCPEGETTCGNPADGNCFTFGGHVDTQEHCNAFVYYWPKVVDIGCF
jgi:hypothetical protein